MSFVGASSRGGFSTKAMTRPSSSVGTTPKADGSATGCRAMVPSAPRSRWNATRAVRSRSVSTSPLTTTKVSSMPANVGGEADGPGRVERLGLDGVGQPHPGGTAVGIGLDEGVGQVAERQDGLVDAVRGQLAEHPLDHRHPDDREHLLGRRERQGTQPRPLAADEDDRLHYFVVVVDEGFVVVVDGALVVVDEWTVVDVGRRRGVAVRRGRRRLPASWSWWRRRRLPDRTCEQGE